MEGNKNEQPHGFERVALDVLAGVIGAVVALPLCGVLVNLVIFHSAITPRHFDTEGAGLGEGFALLMLLPFAIVLLAISIATSVFLFRKLW
ncbi:hypothetical protein [Paraburkholderia tagetis]|uniref:Uncharacterized protein n=1 Tax=Paraburkholderia tagetis TaxID=2913261 RepID=A0A9X1ULY3_9BURK|nr:hypothetical protein [Paraburkholderia tagetis]MCG5077832.1 hypothetical protein [Paraburkholderia tagetis]